LKGFFLKGIILQTDFGSIHILTTDNNTLCTADMEEWKLVNVGEVWVVAVSFVLWTVKCEFMKNI
jgi:hypothetical protein